MDYMRVEDKITHNRRFPKSEFAKAMSCSKKLLDNIDLLTKKVTVNIFHKEENDLLVGNIGCRFCGRWYEDKSIWIGLLFDRTLNYQLSIGFGVKPTGSKKDNTTYIKVEKLLSDTFHLNYHVEYIRTEECYWFYTFLSNSIENYCSILSAFEEIENILNQIR